MTKFKHFLYVLKEVFYSILAHFYNSIIPINNKSKNRKDL